MVPTCIIQMFWSENTLEYKALRLSGNRYVTYVAKSVKNKSWAYGFWILENHWDIGHNKKLIGMGTSIIVFIEKLFYLNMLNICDYIEYYYMEKSI